MIAAGARRRALLTLLVLAAGLAVLPGKSLASSSMAAPQLSSDGVGQLTVAWDTPSPVPDDYRVMWAPEDGDWLSYRNANETERGNLYPGGDQTHVTIDGLKPGGRYKVMMRARDNNGSGPWSAQSVLQVRGAPRLSSDTAGSLTVTWDVPSPAPDSYRIAWAPEDGDWLSYSSVNEAERGNAYPSGDTSSYTITGLTPGDRYKVMMRARYNDGSGPWSTQSAVGVQADEPPPVTTEPLSVTDEPPTETIGARGADLRGADSKGDSKGGGNLGRQTLSTDATLSSLSVSPKDIVGFDAETLHYELGVASTATTATISASRNHSGASVEIKPDDSDTTASGHQVSLSAGRNPVTVTVTAQDTTTTRTYWVTINRGVTAAYGWKASEDLDGLQAAGNTAARGMWSNATTIWVSDASDDKIYAYNKSDKSRDSSKDFNTLSSAGNNNPTGIWSNGTTMWVADRADHKIYAYNMSDKSRDSSKDFKGLIVAPPFAPQYAPTGIWSDGTTMWVTNYWYGKIFAYKMSDKSRDCSKDFDGLISWYGINAHYVIWSEGTTLWVTDQATDKIYAFKMSDKSRDSSKDFASTLALAFNNNLYEIWSDGTTLWVIDAGDNKVYSYNLPT
ncbi:MAG: hypothetical protein F4016_06030 [Acidimicrobiaceae bacterium]|nr:hypothetical protein [Acidimicrobiaceae bacterium]